ncbi:MAG: ATP-binding cassette domain-containing protein [Candidatus Lokiarchaeota archaeon]|nr:ATP-binding cassette domain-containing protein [Candidatus Lokiarchaeota archaeon]
MHRPPRGRSIPGREKHKMERMKLSKLSKTDFGYLKNQIVENKQGFIVSIILTMLTAFFSIFPPLLFKILIDDYITFKNKTGIYIFVVLLCFLYTINWILGYYHNKVTVKTAQNVIAGIRSDVFQKIMKLPISYHTEQKRGELLSIVTNNVTSLSDALTSGLISLFSDFVAIIGVLIIMLKMSPRLTLITFVILPILVVTIRGFRSIVRGAVYKIREKVAELNADVEESISGIREIQSFAMEDKNNEEFNEITEQNVQANLKANILMGVMHAVVSITGFIAIAIVIGIGGAQVMAGALTLGVLVAFLQYINQLIRPISDLSSVYTTFQIAAASLIHINQYMSIENRLLEPKKPIALPKKKDIDILLQNVSFSYGNFKLFDNLDLQIDGGKKTGIVGETGAGKSTLISLITRLYDVDKGKILLEGIDIRNIANKELRENMAVVSQRVMLFSDTVFNNIRFSKPEATKEEVIQAAKLANAHDFISRMPFGYDTQIGEGGAKLSGGQRQLIAYARILLVKPKIVILDEATSNIDSYTENLIQKNMDEILK